MVTRVVKDHGGASHQLSISVNAFTLPISNQKLFTKNTSLDVHFHECGSLFKTIFDEVYALA